jgi:MFS superfamily sulfate permease-like transporter
MTSAIGLLLAKVVARFITQPTVQLAIYLAGVTLALAGLVIIAFGIARRGKNGGAAD